MKILTIICAALGYDTFCRAAKAGFWKNLQILPAKTVFPALTCPVQASFRTGLEPEEHSMPANGFFDRELRKTFFWEQSSKLYKGKRFWEDFRDHGGKVAQISLQQSLGNDSDIIISPAPIHKHHGGMIQDCYSKPPELYQKICSKLGKKFNLFNYWGPFTSGKSSEWITDASAYIMKENLAELIITYLPHLDYDLQRHGPGGKEEGLAFEFLEIQLEKLLAFAKIAGYETLIIGDYSIERAENVIYPNRILLDSGFFRLRSVKNMLYPDLYSSKAFALCDHQVAHIYLQDRNDLKQIKEIFTKTKTISQILEPKDHNKAGDLILLAKHGGWFSYRWWTSAKEAPEYASHVDIHSKPGFDPCELISSLWPPFSISQDDSKIKGTHGLTDGNSGEVLCASTFPIPDNPRIRSMSETIIPLLVNNKITELL